MNRNHDPLQSITALEHALTIGFKSISADLMFGFNTDDVWINDLNFIHQFGIPHISAYNLTIEEKTVLSKKINDPKFNKFFNTGSEEQFLLCQEFLSTIGYEQYELSNYALKGHQAIHNTNYWTKMPYLGFGPSAHSFDGNSKRSWNPSNNAKYFNMANNRKFDIEIEQLSQIDIINELIMLSLRTSKGLDINSVSDINPKFTAIIINKISQLPKDIIIANDNKIMIVPKYWSISDNIIRDLFFDTDDLSAI